MQPAEINFTTTEQEFLAMVHCFHQWRCYAEGAEVFAHSDHEPLTWLASQKHLNRRQSRWMEFLSRFTYSLLYIPGDKNVIADALIRMLDAPRSSPLTLPGDTWPHSTNMTLHTKSSILITEPRTAVPHTTTYICAGPKLFNTHTCMVFGIRIAHPIGPRSQNPMFPRNFPATPFQVLLGGHTRARARAGFSGEGSSQKRVEQGRNQSVNPAPRARDYKTNNDSNTMPSVDGRASECANRVPLQGRSSLDCGLNTSQLKARLDDNTLYESAATSLQAQAEGLAAHERLFDNLFTRLRNAIITDEAVRTDAQRRRLSLVELDGLLWHEGHRLYVPDKDNLRQDILFWHHDVPWMAHLGAQRCIAMMINQYYWPNMRADIATYVKTCVQCQSNKPDRRRNVPALSPLVPPPSCWRILGVDLITELPLTVSGLNSVCVFVCHLSKMVRLVRTTSKLDAVGFAKLLIREILAHYGFPLTIISNRGPQWNNEFFRAMCDQAGVRLTLSTAFHPQTNGLVERTNEVVAAALRHYVTADLNDWDEYLPLVEFALNSSYHDVTSQLVGLSNPR
jgi:hypothetical protein